MFITDKALLKDKEVAIVTQFYTKTTISNLTGYSAIVEQSKDLTTWDLLISLVGNSSADVKITKPYIRSTGSDIYLFNQGFDFTHTVNPVVVTPVNPVNPPTPTVTVPVTNPFIEAGITVDRLQRALDYTEQRYDTDKDSLTDYDEYNVHKTNPIKKDTDGDGFDDVVEIKLNTDPTDPKSFPPPELDIRNYYQDILNYVKDNFIYVGEACIYVLKFPDYLGRFKVPEVTFNLVLTNPKTGKEFRDSVTWYDSSEGSGRTELYRYWRYVQYYDISPDIMHFKISLGDKSVEFKAEKKELDVSNAN